MNIPLVIECSDHQFAPYSFVCKHLLDNSKLKWHPMGVDDGREVEYDWLCGECVENHAAGDDLAEVIIPVCINCVRNLKGEK